MSATAFVRWPLECPKLLQEAHWQAGPLATAVTSLANFDAPINTNGFMGGGQVGYDWQFPWLATALVAGVEVDIQGMSAKASSNVASAIAVTGSPNTLNQSASVDARHSVPG